MGNQTTTAVTGDYGSGRFIEVFGDTTRSRVINFLARNPDEPHHQVQISQSVDASQPMVSRAIKPMRDMGLIEDRSDGVKLNDSVCAESLVTFMEAFDGDC